MGILPPKALAIYGFSTSYPQIQVTDLLSIPVIISFNANSCNNAIWIALTGSGRYGFD